MSERKTPKLPGAVVAAVTLLFTAATALAQQEQTAAEQQPSLQAVVITGSYIPRIDKETPSPVTTITSEDIANSGFTTVADVVRSISADNSGTLPTAFAGAFAAGASGIALRGLTVNSTLVLIDGLRVANYALPDDGQRTFVDLNSIPIGTIERVEVLRDGASSVYGSDAIAGVVNIILKKTFTGFEFTAQVGDSQHGGGFEKHFDFTAGTGDLATDKYNAYVSAEFQMDNRIGVGQRGFPFDTYDYRPWGGNNNNYNPDTSPSGSIYGSVRPGNIVGDSVLDGVPVTGSVTQPLQPCPASAPRTVGASSGNVYCNQDQQLYLDNQPPSKRFGISSRFTVQLNDTTQAYLSGSFYNNQSTFPTLPPAQIQVQAPNITSNIALPPTIPASPVPGAPSCIGVKVPTVNCKLNPNDPFAAQGEAAMINYAFGPLGPLSASVNNHVLRLVGDISGTWHGWTWDNSYVINHTWLDYSLIGFLNYTQLITDVTDGTYNFINPSANSPATLAALAPTVSTNNTTDMDTVVLRGSHELATLPGGPLEVALGAEWRYEAMVNQNFNSPPAMVQQLGVSQAIGSRTITSVSAEFDAPVVESLELNASGRFDHYSDFGNATTPKVGFKWQPLRSFGLRGTYSQGFRAPSFAENGSAEVEGFIPGFGFCPGTPLCAAHGANGYISSYTIGQQTTGNPNIQPEKSKSYTAGILWQPANWLSATADYYYIKKTNLITQPNYGTATTQYAENFTLPPGFSAIFDNLDPAFPAAPPRIATIIGAYINSASEYTDGVDVEVDGRFDLGAAGRLTEQFSATRILSFVYEQAGSPPLQYAGFQSPYALSSGAGTPKDRASLLSTWSKGPVSLSLNVYYIGAYKMYGWDVANACLQTLINGVAPGNCRTASFTYGNFTGSWQVNSQWQLMATVENVLDTKPPVNLPNYAGTNYNPTYSQAGIVGRFFRIGFRFTL